MRHGGRFALTLGREPPIVVVNYDRVDGPRGNDSGFLVVFSDAPLPEEDWDGHEGWLCLHCLVEEHPEVGRAMDLARVHGEMVLDDRGGWVPLNA